MISWIIRDGMSPQYLFSPTNLIIFTKNIFKRKPLFTDNFKSKYWSVAPTDLIILKSALKNGTMAPTDSINQETQTFINHFNLILTIITIATYCIRNLAYTLL